MPSADKSRRHRGHITCRTADVRRKDPGAKNYAHRFYHKVTSGCLGSASRSKVLVGRRRGRADAGEDDADGDVDPEQGADLGLGDLGTLDGGHGQAAVFEEADEAGEDGDHGDQAVVLRREQAGEDDGGADLEDELDRLGPQRDRPAADAAAFEVGVEVVSAEVPVDVRRQ